MNDIMLAEIICHSIVLCIGIIYFYKCLNLITEALAKARDEYNELVDEYNEKINECNKLIDNENN